MGSLEVRTIHLGGSHVRLVNHVRSVHAGAVCLEAVRACVVWILNIDEAVHVSAVGKVTTAGETIEHVVEALRHRAAHRVSSFMTAGASMVIDTVHFAHHGRHGGCSRVAFHLRRRHQASVTRINVSGVRALDGTRNLLHMCRHAGELLLSGSNLRVIGLRGGGGKLTECMRWLEDAGLRRMDLRLVVSMARWMLLSLVDRRMLRVGSIVAVAGSDVLREVRASGSTRVERMEASVLRLLGLIVLALDALAGCNLWRGGVLSTTHVVVVVDDATVRSSKLMLISNWWRSRAVRGGLTHVGNTGVKGLKGRRSR